MANPYPPSDPQSRFCINCTHHRFIQEMYRPHRCVQDETPVIDPVTGETTYPTTGDCQALRAPNGSCRGEFYQQKPARKPNQ